MTAPLVYAHDGADGTPGTPDTNCELAFNGDWNDHDYGPSEGTLLSGLQESNLEDCDGDFDATDPFCWAEETAREDVNGDTDVCEAIDYDGHSDYARGGAWLLVNSGDGVTHGTLLCFGESGHHPTFGPVSVEDLVLGSTVPFIVSTDTINLLGPDPITGIDCGDLEMDVHTACVDTCSVTFPPGVDGSYQVYVGIIVGSSPTQGHVSTGGWFSATDGFEGDLSSHQGCKAIYNGGYCEGKCKINLGYCSKNCDTVVNTGRC